MVAFLPSMILVAVVLLTPLLAVTMIGVIIILFVIGSVMAILLVEQPSRHAMPLLRVPIFR